MGEKAHQPTVSHNLGGGEELAADYQSTKASLKCQGDVPGQLATLTAPLNGLPQDEAESEDKKWRKKG